VARDYFDSHGKDKHGEPLGKYFTHGIGHHVGLDVHDANDPALPLAANMVITVEQASTYLRRVLASGSKTSFR